MNATTPITIRKAAIEDLPRLLEFEQLLITAERPYDVTLRTDKLFHYYDIGAKILSDDAEVMVAIVDGKIVGSGQVTITKGKDYVNFEHMAWLGFMFVLPEFRGLGINRLIIDALKKWAGEKGLKEVRLQVYSENVPALRAYEKVGFKAALTEMRLDLSEE